MYHLSAWEQNINPAGALTPITAVNEATLAVLGNDIRVPTALPFIIGAAATINDASLARAQVQSPSLRVRTNLDVEPIVQGLVFGNPPEQNFWPLSPIPVQPNEALNFAVQSAPAGAVIHRGFVFLSDGPQQEVSANIFTVRVTTGITLATGQWVNGAITFGQVLPAGRYAVVGMRSRGTNLVAARLVFPEQIARPGVLAINIVPDLDPYWTRFGRMGVLGEFEHTVPPTMDCLGVTDTSQVHLLDLVQVK